MDLTSWLVRHKRKLEVAGWLLMVAMVGAGLISGVFLDADKMEVFLRRCGFWAPLVFMAVQALQVVIPILPGAVGCAFGVVFFGNIMGFAYNYIGICIGSILAFCLARKCGTALVKGITGTRFYDKYNRFLENEKKFERIFAILIFLPVAPDDFLCYLAGVSRMSLKRFTAIILLGKPLAIYLYSTALYHILGQAVKMLV